jgi:hypothetical protein
MHIEVVNQHDETVLSYDQALLMTASDTVGCAAVR